MINALYEGYLTSYICENKFYFCVTRHVVEYRDCDYGS
jgi:hypothetical protein